jgi:hypothetical protein
MSFLTTSLGMASFGPSVSRERWWSHRWPLLMICSLEFVGAIEQEGWKLAGVLTPIAYIAWSLWLIVVGVVILL